MLPMWRDSSKCPAMIKHANKILEATEYRNPGQTANVAMDQLLYAIKKKKFNGIIKMALRKTFL